jgi:hypothetical protein
MTARMFIRTPRSVVLLTGETCLLLVSLWRDMLILIEAVKTIVRQRGAR